MVDEALEAGEQEYVRWRSRGRSSAKWLATRHDRVACSIKAAEAGDPRGQLFVALCHSWLDCVRCRRSIARSPRGKPTKPLEAI